MFKYNLMLIYKSQFFKFQFLEKFSSFAFCRLHTQNFQKNFAPINTLKEKKFEFFLSVKREKKKRLKENIWDIINEFLDSTNKVKGLQVPYKSTMQC